MARLHRIIRSSSSDAPGRAWSRRALEHLSRPAGSSRGHRAPRRACLALTGAIACVLALGLAATPVSLGAGLLTPKTGGLPPLEIKNHHVTVVVNNGFAVSEVDQVFHNPHDRDLDALYTFPLPRDASLSELSLWIDGEEHSKVVVERHGLGFGEAQVQLGRKRGCSVRMADYQITTIAR